jgi:hypothetical protein
LANIEFVVNLFIDCNPKSILRLDGETLNQPAYHGPTHDVDERLWKTVAFFLETRANSTDWDDDVQGFGFRWFAMETVHETIRKGISCSHI